MRYESNCGLEVLENLFLRKHLLEMGDATKDSIRPVFFAGGGVLRGVYGAGCGCALEHHDLAESFAAICGSSTGAASAQFLVSRQIRKHIDIYWNEGASREFISFARAFAGEAIEDTHYLSGVFRSKLHLDAFHASSVEFGVGVTHAKTGVGSFVDAKRSASGLHEVVRASIAIPGLCNDAVMVDNEPYYDGVGAMAIPARQLIEQYQPTDLLIFTNAPREEKTTTRKRFVEQLLMRKLEPVVREAFLTRATQFNEGVRHIRAQRGFRWMVVWSDDLSLFERDASVLEAAAKKAELEFAELLLRAKCSFKEKITPRVA